MISFVLNAPYSVIGLLFGLLGFPTTIELNRDPYAIIMKVTYFWWAIGFLKRARAVTIGHVVLLGPREELNDLQHELTHVRQYSRRPFIHPFLYYLELFRKGYKHNKYEIEAYERAGNIYRGN